jgi:hypothetical protein
VLPDQKEWAVVEMVRARIDIRLSEIKQAIEENDDTFANVASISLPTIVCLLKRHQFSMKNIDLVRETMTRLNNWRLSIFRYSTIYCITVTMMHILFHKIILELYCKNN